MDSSPVCKATPCIAKDSIGTAQRFRHELNSPAAHGAEQAAVAEAYLWRNWGALKAFTTAYEGCRY
jgi:hypothetical protein